MQWQQDPLHFDCAQCRLGGLYEGLAKLDPAADKTSSGSVTRTVTYYPDAGAMRINSTLYYILKDQLGSASVVTYSTGAIVGEQRYCEAPLWGYPYGETRLTKGTLYTDKLFTRWIEPVEIGQREMAGLGIYHYGARFGEAGRFLSLEIYPSSIQPRIDPYPACAILNPSERRQL